MRIRLSIIGKGVTHQVILKKVKRLVECNWNTGETRYNSLLWDKDERVFILCLHSSGTLDGKNDSMIDEMWVLDTDQTLRICTELDTRKAEPYLSLQNCYAVRFFHGQRARNYIADHNVISVVDALEKYKKVAVC